MVQAATAVLGTLDAVAALSNLAVLLLIFRSHRTRTVSNLLVAALMLTELLMTLFVVPFSISSFSKWTWQYGSHFCAGHGFLRNSLSYATAILICTISIERYYFIANPMRHAVNVSDTKVVLTAMYVWVQAAVWAVFPLFNIGNLRYVFSPSKMSCAFAWDLGGTYNLYYTIIFIGTFLMPTCAIGVMSYKTLQTARRNANQVRPGNIRFEESQDGEYTSIVQQERFAGMKANLSIVVITGTFLVCRGPLGILNITTAICGRSVFTAQAESVASWLLYLGSLLNPFVYTLLNRGLRREIAQVAMIFKTSAASEEQEPKDIFEYLRTLTENSERAAGLDAELGPSSPPTRPCVMLELRVSQEVEEIVSLPRCQAENLGRSSWSSGEESCTETRDGEEDTARWNAGHKKYKQSMAAICTVSLILTKIVPLLSRNSEYPQFTII